jgi:AcrR family transcriptional regulator
MAKQAERRAATTEAILTVARRLFGTEGFTATTMDEIAEGAGVAKGAVYHHFKT